MIHTFSFQESVGENVPGIITRLANPSLTEWGRGSQFEHSHLSIAVVKLTSAGVTWFLFVPILSRKSVCLSLRYLITCSSTRCQAVLSLLGTSLLCCKVCSMPVTLQPATSLLHSDPSPGRNKDAVIGNFPSLVLPVPVVGLEKQCMEHRSASVHGEWSHCTTQNGAVRGRWLWVEHGAFC